MNSLTQLNVKRLAVFLASNALTACVSGTDASDTPSDPTTETFATSLGVNIPQMTKTTLGDYYKDIAIGNGVALFSQTKAHITYNAYLKTGSMFGTGASVPFALDSVLVGFRDAVIGMNVGGERLIVIPSDLGYGPYQVGVIPPNSTLIFDVKLDSIP